MYAKLLLALSALCIGHVPATASESVGETTSTTLAPVIPTGEYGIYPPGSGTSVGSVKLGGQSWSVPGTELSGTLAPTGILGCEHVLYMGMSLGTVKRDADDNYLSITFPALGTTYLLGPP